MLNNLPVAGLLLDEAVARVLGWTQDEDGDWRDKAGALQRHLPPFSTDSRVALWALEEAAGTRWVVTIKRWPEDEGPVEWRVWLDCYAEDWSTDLCYGPALPDAICRAILRLQGEEGSHDERGCDVSV